MFLYPYKEQLVMVHTKLALTSNARWRLLQCMTQQVSMAPVSNGLPTLLFPQARQCNRSWETHK